MLGMARNDGATGAVGHGIVLFRMQAVEADRTDEKEGWG